MAHARAQAFDEFRDRILAIGADELSERGKEAGLRQAITIDPVVACISPGLVEVGKSGLLLLVVGQGVADGTEGSRMAHELNRQTCALPGAETRPRSEV